MTTPGLRVLELGRRLGVAAAGLALAALDADVVQVQLPGRSVPPAEAAYYDRGRRVVAQAGADDLGELGRRADIVLTDLRDDELRASGVPADESDLRAGPDAQVLVTISSFGRTGPNRDLRATGLTEWAASGLANVTRRPHPATDERYVPVLPPGEQPQALAGLAAATASLVGRRWARAREAPVVADVSAQEVVAAMLHGIFPNYVWNNVVTGNPATPATALGFLLPALDGDVYLRTLDPRQWDAVVAWIDDDALDAIGGDADSRLANHDALALVMGRWTSGRPRAALVEEGQRRHVPIALPRSLDDVLAWQHLRARGVWRSIELAGAVVEVPRLPLLEPPSWRTAGTIDARDAVRAWAPSA